MDNALTVQQQPKLPAVQNETAATAVAARAKALVEARYIMAMQRPRDMDQVRQDIMRECSRPGFADNKSVLYHKPVGDGIEGLGIRFVEAALRHFRNVVCEATTTFDDPDREIVHVSLTDLETNVPFEMDVTIRKVVERSKPLDDGSYISVRKNSYGKNTYTVPATDEDLLNKRGALISKAIRTLGLRLIPGDIQDEAEAIIRKIRLDKAAKDPDAERKSIVDAFGTLNVRAADLAAYLGHDIGQCSPAQLVTLRGLYGAIRDGQTTWKEAIDAEDERRGQKSGVSDLNEKIRNKAAAAKTPAAPASAAGAPTELEVAALINQALDMDALDNAKAIASSMPEPAKTRLIDLAKAREIELK